MVHPSIQVTVKLIGSGEHTLAHLSDTVEFLLDLKEESPWLGERIEDILEKLTYVFENLNFVKVDEK